MKLAIMGTGGVGGLFGARLAEAGHDVVFVARGKHLAAIQSSGLRIESELIGDVTIKPAAATDDPKSIGPVDYVLFTVKLWDTESAAHLIEPLIGKHTAVISLQNGVVRDEILKKILGSEHVIGGTSYVGATIKEPGVITQKGNVQKLAFNEYLDKSSTVKRHTLSPRVVQLVEACKKSNITVETPNDIERTLWEKFVVLVAMSTVTAACRNTIGPLRTNDETRKLLISVMDEVKQIAFARGIDLDDNIIEEKLQYLDALAPDVTASMEHDLRHGNRLELPWLAGSVIDMGKQLNVSTPVCSTLAAILSPYVMGTN